MSSSLTARPPRAARCGRAAASEPTTTERRWARWLYRTAFISGAAGVLLGTLMWLAAMVGAAHFPTMLGRVFLPQTLYFHSRVFLTCFFALFMLGFGYQAFPRFKGRLLPNPPPALAGLFLALAGAVVYLLGLLMLLLGRGPLPAAWGQSAAVLVTLGVLPFPWQLSKVMLARHDEDKTPYDLLLWMGSGGLVLAALADALAQFGLWPTGRAHGTWFLLAVAPLVLGVCQRFMGAIHGLKPAPVWRNVSAGVVLLLGATAWTIFHDADANMAAGLGAVALLLAAFLAGAPAWVLRAAPKEDASAPFFRAAALWWLVGQALALAAWLSGGFGSMLQSATVGFSEHSFALGVGAMSVLGTSLRVAPNLTSRKAPWLGKAARVVFWLLNGAVLLRLLVPLLGALGKNASHPLEASGLLLFLATVLWAAVVLNMMLFPAWPDVMAARAMAAGAPPQANLPLKDQTVEQVLARYPHTLEILIQAGFTPLKNPVVRAAMAPTITIEGAAQRRGLNLDALVHAIETGTPYAPPGPAAPPPPGTAINPDMTLLMIAEIKGAQAGEVYARYGLDSCCGGGKTLREAATAHGHPLDELMKALG